MTLEEAESMICALREALREHSDLAWPVPPATTRALASTEAAAREHDERVRDAALEEAADEVTRSVVMMENPIRITTTVALADQIRALKKGGTK